MKVNVTFETPQQAGLKGNNFFPSNMLDLGPRMGAAYRLTTGEHPWVVRGGYGIYVSPLAIRTLVAQFAGELPFKATYQYNPNSSAYSPTGNNSYLLTNQSPIIAGQNSSNVVDTTNPNSLGIGQSVTALAPHLPSTKISEWDFIIEKELPHNMVARLSYSGYHGWNLDQLNNLNAQQTTYDWYSTTLMPLPTGSYSNVARGPYDSNAYTTINFLAKTGTSNSEVFTGNIEKRYSNGLQFQFFCTLTNAYRLAGNSFRDSPGTQPTQFLPGTVPTDPNALNHFLNYQRDTGTPKHRARWNFIYDLPFGRNKQFLPNPPKWLNAVIGGWTMTGSGTIVSSWFSLDSSNWNFTGTPAQVFGTRYPIEDCTATPPTAKSADQSVCYNGYYYWNGYISPKLINSRNQYGVPNGIEGLPADVKPAVTPLVPYGTPGAVTGDYDTNNVYIVLKNGTRQVVAYNPGLNPFRNQYRLGPLNWNQDASIRKTFRFTESGRVNLRVALDVFNIFNNHGLNPPGTNGITDLKSNYGAFGFQPRQCQGSFRFEF
jgi:hypothetical protein